MTAAETALRAAVAQLLPAAQRMESLLSEDAATAEPGGGDGSVDDVQRLLRALDRVGKLVRTRQTRVRQLALIRRRRAEEAAAANEEELGDDGGHFEGAGAEALAGFDYTFDVHQPPYDIAEEFTKLAIEQSKRELQANLARSSSAAAAEDRL